MPVEKTSPPPRKRELLEPKTSDKVKKRQRQLSRKAVNFAYAVNTCIVSYDPEARNWVVTTRRKGVGKKRCETKAIALGYAKQMKARFNVDIIEKDKNGKILKSPRHGL